LLKGGETVLQRDRILQVIVADDRKNTGSLAENVSRNSTSVQGLNIAAFHVCRGAGPIGCCKCSWWEVKARRRLSDGGVAYIAAAGGTGQERRRCKVDRYVVPPGRPPESGLMASKELAEALERVAGDDLAAQPAPDVGVL
jgi:hypothetical protein